MTEWLWISNRNCTVYADLFSYRKSLMIEAEQQGIPLVRSMWLEFPNCEPCKHIDDQFMFGSKYLVAPVLQPSTSEKRLFLPAGKWLRLHLDGGETESKGQWVTVDAPLGKPAVFQRLPNE